MRTIRIALNHVLCRSGVRRLGISAAFVVLLSACQLTAPTPTVPITPQLHAVLLPGNPPTFAFQQTSGHAYEALPAPAVLLRMVNPLPPQPSATRIVLRFRNGVVSAPLEYVRSDDTARKQALANVGYFEVIQDGFAYTVVVAPPVAERNGAGFDVELKNVSSNPPAGTSPESQALLVSVLPKITRVKPSDVFFDCGIDITGADYHNCKKGNAVAIRDFTLEGWLFETYPNSFFGMAEDHHYYFIPNVDFLDAIYGPRGTLAALTGMTPFTGLRTNGNPAQSPAGQQLFHDVDMQTRSSKGVTINSLVLPFNIHSGNQTPADLITVKTELNAWYVSDNHSGARRYVSRGPAPGNWQPVLHPSQTPPPGWDKTRWPYSPWNPDGGLAPLSEGEYIRVNGALYVDESHGDGIGTTPWEAAVPGHGGWMEIHPPDWIRRVPAPTLQKTPVMAQWIGAVNASRTLSFAPRATPQPGDVLRCRELIDGRFTVGGVAKTVAVTATDVSVSLTVTTPGGRYKAVYLVWWEPGTVGDTSCISQ